MEMDRPSVAFALFLDSIVIGQPEPDKLDMLCTECEAPICLVEEGDDLRVLLNTALAHTCNTKTRKGGKA